MENIGKWRVKYNYLIPVKGRLDIDSFIQTIKDMSKEIRRYDEDLDYLEIREYWFYIDEELLPALATTIENNLNSYKNDLEYCSKLVDALVFLLITKLDAAQRYGFVQEDSMPIGGIKTAMYLHENLDENEDYLKTILKDKELVVKRQGVTVEEAYKNLKEAITSEINPAPPNEKLKAFVEEPFKG